MGEVLKTPILYRKRHKNDQKKRYGSAIWITEKKRRLLNLQGHREHGEEDLTTKGTKTTKKRSWPQRSQNPQRIGDPQIWGIDVSN